MHAHDQPQPERTRQLPEPPAGRRDTGIRVGAQRTHAAAQTAVGGGSIRCCCSVPACSRTACRGTAKQRKAGLPRAGRMWGRSIVRGVVGDAGSRFRRSEREKRSLYNIDAWKMEYEINNLGRSARPAYCACTAAPRLAGAVFHGETEPPPGPRAIAPRRVRVRAYVHTYAPKIGEPARAWPARRAHPKAPGCVPRTGMSYREICTLTARTLSKCESALRAGARSSPRTADNHTSARLPGDVRGRSPSRAWLPRARYSRPIAIRDAPEVCTSRRTRPACAGPYIQSRIGG